MYIQKALKQRRRLNLHCKKIKLLEKRLRCACVKPVVETTAIIMLLIVEAKCKNVNTKNKVQLMQFLIIGVEKALLILNSLQILGFDKTFGLFLLTSWPFGNYYISAGLRSYTTRQLLVILEEISWFLWVKARNESLLFTAEGHI